MRILIIGTGVIGVTYAWQIAQAGHDVTLFVKKGRKEAIVNEGVAINCLDMRGKKRKQIHTIYHSNVTEEIITDEEYELIILPVKVNQLDSILPILAEKAGNADILFFQNYWSSRREIEKYLKPSQYLFGFPWIVGGGREGNTINCTIFDYSMQATMLGEQDGQITPRLKKIAEMLESAKMKPKILDDILGWLQTHYVMYIGVVGAILKAGSVSSFSSRISSVKEAILATKECLEVCRARGVNPHKYPPLSSYYLPLFITLPIGYIQYRMRDIQVMLEENLVNAKEEIITQYYDVLNEGIRLNVDLPLLKGFQKYFDEYGK